MLRVILLATAFVATAFAATIGAATAAELRPATTVTGAYVTLGDLFDEAGDASNVIVADAPAPGMRGEISISRISMSARRSGVEWRNTSNLTHVVVARSGINVPDADVSDAIALAITSRNPALSNTDNLQIDFANGNAGVQVAEGEAQTVSVEQIAFNPRTAQFDVLLRAPANDMLSPLRRLSGRAYPVAQVPVLQRDMQPGEVVRADDIEWVKLPTNRVSLNMITSQDKLLGMSPRRPVRQGEPVRINDMQPPVVVEKGTQVDVFYQTGVLSLTARGRALESGAVGDVVSILNTTSNRTIQGVVTGPNAVSITAPGTPSASASYNTSSQS